MIDEVHAFTSSPIELELSGTKRAVVNHVMQHHFAAVNKRSLPDLHQRVADYCKKITALALVIRLKYTTIGKDSRLVSEAEGSAAITLQELKTGTLWFDGWNTLEYDIMCVIQD